MKNYCIRKQNSADAEKSNRSFFLLLLFLRLIQDNRNQVIRNSSYNMFKKCGEV